MAELVSTDVLFEIKKENLETGLRGYPVGYCITSSVDPLKGLFYQGLPVSELAFCQPEEVIYLLWHGKKGAKEQINHFMKQIQQRARLSPLTIKHIQALPAQGSPMKMLCAALLITGMLEGKGEWYEDGLNLVAKIPQIVAMVIRQHAGWSGLRDSKPELGYMENFAHMLDAPGCKIDEITDIFKVINILHYDHGGGNLSAFTGKAVASGLEDMYGSIASAMCALAGSRHGKANQDSLGLLLNMLEKLGEDASLDEVQAEIRAKLGRHELIYGFGHAVLRVEDPRAAILYKMAEEHYPDHPVVKMALKMRQATPAVLMENQKVSDPYANVDAISGSLMYAAGFCHPQYFTLLFALARVVGISRQIIYEREEALDGKGLPIYRPKYFWKPQKQ